jgi:hypothetical protein
MASADYIHKMEPSVFLEWFRIDLLCAQGECDKAIEMERHYQLAKGKSSAEVDVQLAQLARSYAEEGAPGYWRVKLEELRKSEDWAYGQAGLRPDGRAPARR